LACSGGNVLPETYAYTLPNGEEVKGSFVKDFVSNLKWGAASKVDVRYRDLKAVQEAKENEQTLLTRRCQVGRG
jgi:hypothetical protein